MTRLLTVLLMASLVAGQLWRVPVWGQPGGLVLSDLVIALVLLWAYWSTLFKDKKPSRYSGLAFLSLLPFLAWSLFSWTWRWGQYGYSEILVAASYWVRLSAILLLLPALSFLWQEKKHSRFASSLFVWAGCLAAVLGVVQFIFWPDLSFLKGGFDPHQFRLVSTWLDPNFVGAFLVIVLFFAFGDKTLKPKLSLLAALLLSVAVVLTKSRSVLLAFSATILFLSPVFLVRTRKLFVSVFVVVIMLCAGVAATFLLGDRALGLVTADATVSLRAESLTVAWQVAQKHSWAGLGYNFLPFAEGEGLAADGSLNSRAGVDNSWLTLWLTTGVLGVILFLLPWLLVGQRGLLAWLKQEKTSGLSAVAAILFLFLHAQFVNSFLYVHLLLALVIVAALLFVNREQA